MPMNEPRKCGTAPLDPDRVWAIVPVKLLSGAKSRLAPVMTQAERESLCLGMFEHVLDALAGSRAVGHWAAVSPDARILRVARQRGGTGIPDLEGDLNGALRQGVRVAVSRGAEAVLMLPADLPLLRSSELDELVSLATESPCAVIARAESDGGTNALLVRPPRALQPAFGTNSFEAHLHQARDLGIPIHVFEAPGLALDLDTPDALATVLAASGPIQPAHIARWETWSR